MLSALIISESRPHLSFKNAAMRRDKRVLPEAVGPATMITLFINIGVSYGVQISFIAMKG
jgi:hypothetical protein